MIEQMRKNACGVVRRLAGKGVVQAAGMAGAGCVSTMSFSRPASASVSTFPANPVLRVDVLAVRAREHVRTVDVRHEEQQIIGKSHMLGTRIGRPWKHINRQSCAPTGCIRHPQFGAVLLICGNEEQLLLLSCKVPRVVIELPEQFSSGRSSIGPPESIVDVEQDHDIVYSSHVEDSPDLR